jgi:hypothetical protein
MFPSPPGADILEFSSTDSADIEVLPVRSGDGSVVVMVVDYAVATPSDNNGAGMPRTVAVDVSALGSFSSASLLTIDASTDVTNGPTERAAAPTSTIELTLRGYGTAFLKLH